MFPIPAIMLGDPDGNTYIALIIGAIAGVLLLSGMRRRQRERSRAVSRPPAPRPTSRPAESWENKEKLRRDLEMLIGELQDLSRKISAEIDTRFGKLEAAIRDADRRIAVLNRMSRGAGQDGPDAPAATGDGDVRYTVVYELADAGFSPVEIAKDLGRTPGEIELILESAADGPEMTGA